MLKKPVSDFEVEIHSKMKDRTVFYSRYAFLMAHNGIRPNCLHGMMGTTGCLSGDTIIHVNRNGNSRKYSLKDLCVKYGAYPNRENDQSFFPVKSNKTRAYLRDEGRIGLNSFIDVCYKGIQETFLMELENGMSIRATSDHHIQTIDGMLPLELLSVGDEIMVDAFPLPKKGKTKPRLNDTSLAVGKYHPYAKPFIESRSNREIRRIQKHRLIYEAHINNMEIKEFQEATKAPNSLKFIDPSIYDIHHIDFDHSNNKIENLAKLTKSEHKKIHAKRDGHKSFSQGKITYSKIAKIERHGTEEVFDLQEVHKNHNFSANGIIVSNCGKSTLLKCIIAEAATENRILVWLSEEDIVEYQELITKLDKSVLSNIVFVEEKHIPQEYLESQDQFFEYFRQMTEEADCDLVFIDNITTSIFYNSRFGFIGQQRTAHFLQTFVKTNCSVFYISHTRSEVTDNYGKVATPEDIRGSKDLPLVTEYMYIIQKFTTEDKQFNVLRVAKYRHHEGAAGWYGLKYEQKAYIGDSKVPFAVINKIFKMRDHFGKKLPKKDPAKKDEGANGKS